MKAKAYTVKYFVGAYSKTARRRGGRVTRIINGPSGFIIAEGRTPRRAWAKAAEIVADERETSAIDAERAP